MRLSDPLISGVPFHVWLGMVVFFFAIVQILIGTRILKVPFWIHTRVVWVIILLLGLIHGFYGYQIYFLNK